MSGGRDTEIRLWRILCIVISLFLCLLLWSGTRSSCSIRSEALVWRETFLVIRLAALFCMDSMAFEVVEIPSNTCVLNYWPNKSFEALCLYRYWTTFQISVHKGTSFVCLRDDLGYVGAPAHVVGQFYTKIF